MKNNKNKKNPKSKKRKKKKKLTKKSKKTKELKKLKEKKTKNKEKVLKEKKDQGKNKEKKQKGNDEKDKTDKSNKKSHKKTKGKGKSEDKIEGSSLRDTLQTKVDAIKKLLKKRQSKVVINAITAVLFLVGIYLVVYPFIPALYYETFQEGKEFYPYESQLNEEEEDNENSQKSIPEDNRLVIPGIGVDMAIVQGETDKALDLGVWHRPGTGSPGTGNMVLTGHRVGYAFLPEDVKTSTSFYNLDKLENGDYVIIYWEGKEYDYEVYDWEIVDKTATYIENQDTDERLTLYTCHPIGQNEKRLVYYAKRIETPVS